MSKLDPKPTNRVNRDYSWDDLNGFLQSYFGSHPNDFVFIDLRDYSMEKGEIIDELKRNGYKVSEHSEHKLRVE